MPDKSESAIRQKNPAIATNEGIRRTARDLGSADKQDENYSTSAELLVNDKPVIYLLEGWLPTTLDKVWPFYFFLN